MTYPLRVSRNAAQQIREANRWWLENRDKTPNAFAEDLETAFQLLADLPGVGERVLHSRISGIRRLLMSRVRYHLYYFVSDDSVEILSLWHASRGRMPDL